MLLKYQIKTSFDRLTVLFRRTIILIKTKYYAWQYKYINKTPASLYFFFWIDIHYLPNVISISNFAMQQSLYEGDTLYIGRGASISKVLSKYHCNLYLYLSCCWCLLPPQLMSGQGSAAVMFTIDNQDCRL